MVVGYPRSDVVWLMLWLAMCLMTRGASAARHGRPSRCSLRRLGRRIGQRRARDRFKLQREGYAAAFRSAAGRQAIRSTSTGSIAVAMLQWTGPTLHVVAVDWSLVDDAASAERFAAASGARRACCSAVEPRSAARSTTRWECWRVRLTGRRQVIDVSGDGANNRGRPAEDARDEAVDAGIAINGLPILTLEPDLADYYRQNVIGGPGAFVIAVNSYEEFAAAVRTKLVTEIAGEGSGEHVVDVCLDRGQARQARRAARPAHRASCPTAWSRPAAGAR